MGKKMGREYARPENDQEVIEQKVELCRLSQQYAH